MTQRERSNPARRKWARWVSAPGGRAVELRASELAMIRDGIDVRRRARLPRDARPARGGKEGSARREGSPGNLGGVSQRGEGKIACEPLAP